MKEPLGRIYQEEEFTIPFFDGMKLEKLMVCEVPETGEPILVYIKAENQNWHQFFLDAGIGFWESWDDTNKEDEFSLYPDYVEKFEISERTIKKIYCEKDLNNSQIVIELNEGEEIILRCKNSEIIDSEKELVKVNSRVKS